MRNRNIYLAAVALILAGVAAFLVFTSSNQKLADAEGVEKANQTNPEFNVSSCKNAVRTQCLGLARTVSAPTACLNGEGNVPQVLAEKVEGLQENGLTNCRKR